MKVFLDTNIFLNIFLAESESHDCLRLLDFLHKNGSSHIALTSCISLANMAYVLRKRSGKEKVAPTISQLIEYLGNVSDCTGSDYTIACLMRSPDFEDLLQYVNAANNGCDIIVTCNKADYLRISDPDAVLGSPGPEILSPAEFISRFLCT